MAEKNISLKFNLTFIVNIILLLSIINASYFKLWHILSTNIFLLILMFIPRILKKTSKIKIPKEFEIALIIFVLITLLFGKAGGKITPLIFGITIGFIGYLILLILYSGGQIKKNYFLILFFAFSFSVTIGFLIELSKYYLKLALGQNLTPEIYQVAMINMSYVILGAMIASIFGFIYLKKKGGIISHFLKKIIDQNPETFKKETNKEEIYSLIQKGESDILEFKSTLRKNLYTNEFDKKIENSVLKTIIAFLNSKGGTLLIGIENSGKILGIEKDKFENEDKFLLYLINILKRKIGKNILSLIKIESIKIEEKTIIKLEIEKSKKPIFLKEKEKEEFFVRIGPSTHNLSGSELIDYFEKKFKK